MSPHEAQRLIDCMSDAQRRALRSYARHKAAGAGVPVDTMREVVAAVRFAARIVGVKLRGGQETQDALAACARLAIGNE